jgi:hypothetical protein
MILLFFSNMEYLYHNDMFIYPYRAILNLIEFKLQNQLKKQLN